MSVNKVILVGNLARKPEVRFLQSGKAVCTFSMATNEKWTNAEGQPQERTEWHRIVVFGKAGENCGTFLSKGRQVYVEGKIRQREYDDKDKIHRRITEIIADQVRFLGAKGGGRHGDDAPEHTDDDAPTYEPSADMDIPPE